MKDLEFEIAASAEAWTQLFQQWQSVRNRADGEMSFLIPPHLIFCQLGYGQCEGGVQIQWVEYGFYVELADVGARLRIVVHDVADSAIHDDHAEVVTSICSHWSERVGSKFEAVPRIL